MVCGPGDSGKGRFVVCGVWSVVLDVGMVCGLWFVVGVWFLMLGLCAWFVVCGF